jgi:hypothetical protein
MRIQLFNFGYLDLTSKDLVAYQKTIKKLKKYIEVDRGIPPYLHEILTMVKVLKHPKEDIKAKNYFYVGIPNYKNNGFIGYGYYDKIGRWEDGELNPVYIGNARADNLYFFQNLFDFLSYLALKKDFRKTLRENFFCIIPSKIGRKKDFEWIESLYSFSNKKHIYLCFQNTKVGNTLTNNALKTFGDNTEDKRDIYLEYKSLNKYLLR